MKVIHIDKKNWASGLEALKTAFCLYGPVKENTHHEFAQLTEGVAPDFQMQNTRLSAKGIIYPQSQEMFHFTLDESDPAHHQMQLTEENPIPKAVIGIRPCDATAFGLVEKNFDTPDYRDPYWADAYQTTTLVGLACDSPCSTCFCLTAGSGPYDETGLDVLLAESDDHFLARVITEKGQVLMDAAGWNTEADGAVLAGMKQAAEKRVTAAVETDHLADLDTLDLYEADFWQDVSFSCINCGTCTFVCPTCWCFDIQDEVHGKKGARLRNWDSCMFPLFTHHGSGHNPRGTKLHRVRQRFMHKLKYYVDKYGNGIQCVGCGRCIRSCPVNIDIRRVCELMNRHGAQVACNRPAA
jgi:sulfhydrogenase subunit beta (sulfur reductase)